MIRLAMIAWLVTVVIEVPVVALIYKKQRIRMIVTSALATSVTNLTMNLVLFRVLSWNNYLLVGELGALVLEAFVYWQVARPKDLPRALVASASANIASFMLGASLMESWVGWMR